MTANPIFFTQDGLGRRSVILFRALDPKMGPGAKVKIRAFEAGVGIVQFQWIESQCWTQLLKIDTAPASEGQEFGFAWRKRVVENIVTYCT